MSPSLIYAHPYFKVTDMINELMYFEREHALQNELNSLGLALDKITQYRNAASDCLEEITDDIRPNLKMVLGEYADYLITDGNESLERVKEKVGEIWESLKFILSRIWEKVLEFLSAMADRFRASAKSKIKTRANHHKEKAVLAHEAGDKEKASVHEKTANELAGLAKKAEKSDDPEELLNKATAIDVRIIEILEGSVNAPLVRITLQRQFRYMDANNIANETKDILEFARFIEKERLLNARDGIALFIDLAKVNVNDHEELEREMARFMKASRYDVSNKKTKYIIGNTRFSLKFVPSGKDAGHRFISTKIVPEVINESGQIDIDDGIRNAMVDDLSRANQILDATITGYGDLISDFSKKNSPIRKAMDVMEAAKKQKGVKPSIKKDINGIISNLRSAATLLKSDLATVTVAKAKVKNLYGNVAHGIPV